MLLLVRGEQYKALQGLLLVRVLVRVATAPLPRVPLPILPWLHLTHVVSAQRCASTSTMKASIGGTKSTAKVTRLMLCKSSFAVDTRRP